MKRNSRQIYTEWLVLKAQEGDEDAFAKLYKEWTPDFQRLAYIQIKEQRDIDEIVQTTWISIARNLTKLNDPACFPRWAFRILECRCIDWIRTLANQRQKRAGIHPEEYIEEPNKNENDETELLQEGIDALDQETRKLIHLFYIQDLSVAEISEVLGIPNGTVKSRLSKARETLKSKINYIEK